MRTWHICSSALMALLLWTTPGLAQDINEAASQGDLAQVKTWVEKDPQLVNFKDKDGRTPLHWASRGIHLDVLAYLVEHGANVNARDNDRVTALHSLSYRGDAGAMEILITEGADVEVKEVNGMTPLMYAAYGGQKAATTLLLKHGASIKVKDETGLTVADIAADQGHEMLSQYLLSIGSELTPVADAEITELSGNIHKITFCHEQCTNMLVVDGAGDMLVIDTGYPRTKEKLKVAIQNIGKGKRITVINTHQHYDHIGGNSLAGEDGKVIAYENLEQMVTAGILKESKDGLQGASGKEYPGGYTLNFNHQRVRLIPLTGAHTDGDMAVYFKDAGIVHMGDLLISQSFPSLTRGKKIHEYLAIFEKVTDIFNQQTIFVGGHGRNLNKRELLAYLDMLRETIDIVVTGMKAGKSAKTMKHEGVLNKYVTYDTFIPQLNTGYWIEAVHENFMDVVPKPPEK